MRTLMGKTRPEDRPYMIFEGGPFGPTRVLKGYQGDDAKPYARWFVRVGPDLGDTYVADIVRHEVLTYIDPDLEAAGYAPPAPWEVAAAPSF